MKVAISNLGKNISEEEILEAFDDHDLAKNGYIDFEEFKVMLLGDLRIGTWLLI